MAKISTISDRYNFLGNAWSFWPSYNDRGNLNIVSGIRRPAHEILSVLLIRKGEDPIHPDFGLAPDIFQPLSAFEPQYWVYHAETEIQNWVKSISSFGISITGYDNINNQLSAQITYFPISSPDKYSLIFPFWSYQGAIYDGEIEAFLSAVSINGQSFQLV